MLEEAGVTRNHAQGDVGSGDWHTLPVSDKGQGSNISGPAARMDLVAFLLGSRRGKEPQA